MGELLGSIPSPSSGQIHLGPLRLTAYGLMIALGVVAAVEIARRRHVRRGGDPDDFSQIAVWGVIAGLIGARAYHVLTDIERFRGQWGDVVKVWEGGLGIPGGLVAGVLAGLWAARRRGLGAAYSMDVVAPALPVAQAIGRWGNWWNQELYGRPTSLPWGLEIDAAHQPAGDAPSRTYHPTFLYESLWNLALAGFIVWLEPRTRERLKPGGLFAVYVAGYGIGRCWVESLRIDPAQMVFGLRVNLLVAAVVAGAALLWLAVFGRVDAEAAAGFTSLDSEPAAPDAWVASEQDHDPSPTTGQGTDDDAGRPDGAPDGDGAAQAGTPSDPAAVRARRLDG